MGVDRLNPVQKATYLKKTNSGKMKNVQELLRQLQTSDHRLRAITALISAAGSVKWIGTLS